MMYMIFMLKEDSISINTLNIASHQTTFKGHRKQKLRPAGNVCFECMLLNGFNNNGVMFGTLLLGLLSYLDSILHELRHLN